MMQIFDPETCCIKEITEEEYQEQLKIGKENAYQNLFKKKVEEIAQSYNMSFKDVVNALRLMRSPSHIGRLFEWVDYPEFMERLFQETNCTKKNMNETNT